MWKDTFIYDEQEKLSIICVGLEKKICPQDNFRHNSETLWYQMVFLRTTLVNAYVDLVVFTRIAGTSYTGSGRYWCLYFIENYDICLKDYRIRSFWSIQYVHRDLCKHLGIYSSTDHPENMSSGIPFVITQKPCDTKPRTPNCVPTNRFSISPSL